MALRPNLFELKPLKDLKEVHQFYLNAIYNAPHPWNLVCCPICKGEEFESQFLLDNIGYVRCNRCKSIYAISQLVTPLQKEYNTYRDRLVIPSAKLRYRLGIEKYEQIQQHCKPKGSLLDVGCGTGQLLDIFNEQDWIATGVDPDYKRKYVFNGTFEELNIDTKFNCITFFGVLEHVNNPIELLKKAKRMLKPDGLIVFEVPSADCLLMKYLQKHPFSPYRYIEHTRHLSFFSRYAIEHLCNTIGLTIVDIKTVGFDLQTILLTEQPELLVLQEVLNESLMADHWRIFAKG